MTTTDIHTLAGAYALDAVNDIERAEFARHVASCDSCAQEIAELRATVSRLTDASAKAPPPRLKTAVLEAVAQTRQLPPARTQRSEVARRSRGWRTWAAGVAAAAVVAVGAGGIGYTISDHRVRQDRTQIQAAAAAQIQAATAQNQRVSQILTASDARVTKERVPGGGVVTVVVSARLNRGVALLADMPALTSGQVYELWLIHGGQPVPAGVMNPGVLTGTVFLTDVAGATSFGVSSEVTGGATTPHSPLVTSFALST